MAPAGAPVNLVGGQSLWASISATREQIIGIDPLLHGQGTFPGSVGYFVLLRMFFCSMELSF